MAVEEPTKRVLEAGTRNEKWVFDLLNFGGSKIGSLVGVVGGEIKQSIHDRIRGGGSLTYTGEPEDWDRHMIRIWYVLVDEAGEEFGWPLLTAVPASQPDQYSDGGHEVGLELYDKLIILDQDLLPSSYAISKGASVIDAVKDLVQGSADYDMTFVADSSSETQRTERVFDPGTPRLTIINELLDSIGFMALWCDGRGRFRATRAVSARDRSVAWEFRDNEFGLYSPEFTRDKDSFEVPNRVVAFVEGDEDNEGLMSVAEDTDPDSPWSRPSRGRWVTRELDDTDASSQNVLDGKVQRALQSGQSSQAKLSFTHDVLPLELNNVVLFFNDAHDVEARATLETVTTSIDFSGDSVQESEFRGVQGDVE